MKVIYFTNLKNEFRIEEFVFQIDQFRRGDQESEQKWGDSRESKILSV